jgi:hypothetical protein
MWGRPAGSAPLSRVSSTCRPSATLSSTSNLSRWGREVENVEAVGRGGCLCFGPTAIYSFGFSCFFFLRSYPFHFLSYFFIILALAITRLLPVTQFHVNTSLLNFSFFFAGLGVTLDTLLFLFLFEVLKPAPFKHILFVKFNSKCKVEKILYFFRNETD